MGIEASPRPGHSLCLRFTAAGHCVSSSTYTIPAAAVGPSATVATAPGSSQAAPPAAVPTSAVAPAVDTASRRATAGCVPSYTSRAPCPVPALSPVATARAGFSLHSHVRSHLTTVSESEVPYGRADNVNVTSTAVGFKTGTVATNAVLASGAVNNVAALTAPPTAAMTATNAHVSVHEAAATTMIKLPTGVGGNILRQPPQQQQQQREQFVLLRQQHRQRQWQRLQ